MRVIDSAPPRANDKRADIQGLRAVAVVMVMLYHAGVVRILLTTRPTLVVTSAKPYMVPGLSITSGRPYLVTGYQRWWQRLHSKGIAVAVIADTPAPNIDEDVCVAGNRGHLRRCAEDRWRFTWQGDGALARAARRTGYVHRLDFNHVLCPWQRCPAVLANVLLWRETNHITATYARSAQRQVGQAVAGVLRATAPRSPALTSGLLWRRL